MLKSPFLISNPINICYLTKLNIFLNSDRDAFILLNKNNIYLLINSLYFEETVKLNKQNNDHHFNIRIIQYSQQRSFAKLLLKILINLKIKSLKFEADDLKVSEYKQLKKQLTGIRFIPSIKVLDKLRAIKTATEILNLQTTAYFTDECFKYIVKHLKPKVNETEIAEKIEKFFKQKNVEIAFSPVVAFGSNTSQPHHSPSNDNRLKTIDIILLDFGAKVNEYCSDMTRTIFIGKPTREQKKVYLTLLNIHKIITDNINSSIRKKSINGAILDKMAKQLIKKAGFLPYTHSLGHGVGLQIHEAPRLSSKKPEILKPGMVFTLEPAIYIKGKFGIRIENTVLLTKKGVEFLTTSSKELTILK
jgi:Xaa-Pro aminopeptidase